MKRIAALCTFYLLTNSTFAQNKTYWGNDVPNNWTGNWPDSMRTEAEKSNFTYTANNQDILKYFSDIVWQSENAHVFNMFVSDRGRTCPVLVMSNPRITSPQQAKESGKTVVYLQGGIHPAECEGKEALLLTIRDILFGDKKYLLDELIILVAPNFNVDGNETRVVNLDNHDGNPRLTGTRRNAAGYDVNRDGIKLQTKNMQGAYRNIFNSWDPTLIYDTHHMGSVRHGYAIAQAGSNVVTAQSGPRDYVTYKMFPSIVELSREIGQIEVGMHCGLDNEWPPKEFTHDNSIWSTEAKFQVNAYGLRNRLAILVETPGDESFEKAVYSQYVYVNALLEYTYRNGKEMQAICIKAEEEVVNQIKTKAASGKLKNFVSGKYVSEGKISMPAYRDRNKVVIPGTSVRKVHRPEPPEMVENVDLITKPIGTKEATVPRGYIIPAELSHIVKKLRQHGAKVTKIEDALTVSGEEFIIKSMTYKPMGYARYMLTTLDGEFVNIESKTFPAGSYQVDMAQPLANAIFYCLEPQIRDGLMGWNFLDDYLDEHDVNEKEVAYPIFKYFKIKK